MTKSGRVITFYSYKGGTGRTLALANIGWILASRGHRVCMIDWDLEAPGLHRYFYPFLLDPELTSTDGLIDFVAEYSRQALTPTVESKREDWYCAYADLASYAVSVEWEHFPEPGRLDLVVAGRQGPGYSSRVNSFEWSTFYERFGGGAFLEEAKRQIKAEYDFILIDSRTGVSDTAGICTAQFPDQLVVCFNLNFQSIDGGAAVARSVTLLRPDPTFEIYPVPMRVDLAEKDRLERTMEYAKSRFSPFIGHVPAAEHDRYWGDVEVHYNPYYSYGETLATIRDRPAQTQSLLGSMERICSRLTAGAVRESAPPPAAERARVLDRYAERFLTSATWSAGNALRGTVEPHPSSTTVPGLAPRAAMTVLHLSDLRFGASEV